MVYNYSYTLPILPYGDSYAYNEYAQLQGIRQITGMICRDFKYDACGVDNWSGQPQYKLELVVFKSKEFNSFLGKLKKIMTLQQAPIFLQLLKELEEQKE